ncbi:hypothetical protein CKJ89_38830, partial [Klebsiella pneumoniae]
CAAICLTAGSSNCPAEPELRSDQYRPEQIVPVKTFLAEQLRGDLLDRWQQQLPRRARTTF